MPVLRWSDVERPLLRVPRRTHFAIAPASASTDGAQIHDGDTFSRRSATSPTGVEMTGTLHMRASLTTFGEPSVIDVRRRQSDAFITSGTSCGAMPLIVSSWTAPTSGSAAVQDASA